MAQLPTPEPTPTPQPTPTTLPTPTPTGDPTPTPGPTPTPEPTPTQQPTPTAQPTATPTPTGSPTPTGTPPPALGRPILINEIDANNPGAPDTMEFIELFDGGAGNTPLDGLVVVLFDGFDDRSYRAFDLDGRVTDGAGYFILGNRAVPGVDLIFNDNLLQNGNGGGADAIALYAANASQFPGGTPVTVVDLLDAFVYDTVEGDDDPTLRSLLLPGQPQINAGGTGPTLPLSFQRCPNGALTDRRTTTTYILAPPTPGSSNLCPTPPTGILINEVDALAETATTSHEFIELYDGGRGRLSLDGLIVVLFDGRSDASYASFALDGSRTDAAGFFVLGSAAVVPSGGKTIPDRTLLNRATGVALYVGSEIAFPSGVGVTTANLRDAFVYGVDEPDDPGLLTLLNPGQPQIDEAAGGSAANHSNQRCPDGAGGARNSTAYLQRPPTPGSPNACPAQSPTPTVSPSPTGTGSPTPSGRNQVRRWRLYD